MDQDASPDDQQAEPEQVRLQAEVSKEFYEELREKAPAGESMNKNELTRYWLSRGVELTDLERARAGADTE